MTGVMFLRGHDSGLLWIVSDVFFHDFWRFSTIFPRFELKIVFFGNKVEVENGIFFRFFRCFNHYFTKYHPIFLA